MPAADPVSGFDLGDLVRAAGTGTERTALRLRLEALAASTAPLAADTTATILDEIASFIRRYIVLTPHQLDAIALWVLHTRALDAADVTPYLTISSPEKRCGKTTLLDVLELLVERPWLTGRVTAAVLSRKVDAEAPTLLLDESDAAFKGGEEYAEALRGILNSGHRRGGKTSCCVGTGANIGYQDFSTFCPKAIAGIGKRLPDTVVDRSIPIEMKRRAAGERVERFRIRKVRATARPLQERIARWVRALDVAALAEAGPDIPDQLDDRAADGWEPLLAIADTADDGWATRARAAALALSTGDAREDDSRRVQLLDDIRTVFERRNVDRLTTSALIGGLAADPDGPWADWCRQDNGAPEKGVPRRLALMLKHFGVRSKTVRFADGTTAKGYMRDEFKDAWARYTPTHPSHASQPNAQAVSTSPGTRNNDLAVTGSASAATPHPQADVTDVTQSAPNPSASS